MKSSTMEEQPLLPQHRSTNTELSVYETAESHMEVQSSTPDMSKARILWNIIVINSCFFVFLTCFPALTNIQSTAKASNSIGLDSKDVISYCSLISCILLPNVVIERFGCKRVIVIGTLLQLPYLTSNLSLRSEFLLIASGLFGLVSGPLYSAVAVYIHELAFRFQRFTKQSMEYVAALFFGLFLFCNEVSLVVRNALSFMVHQGKNEYDNVSNEKPCGIQFADNVNGSYLELPAEHQKEVWIGIYLALGAIGIFVLSLSLDPLGNDTKQGRGCKTTCSRFLKPIKHTFNPDQILLIPISMVIGMQRTLYLNEFTEAYIACSWGVHHVGFVTICFGVCGALMSLLVGPLVKCVSQMAVLILAALANISICVLLFLWDPSPETTSIYFIIAGVWGMSDAIWWSQITALYGLMFPNDREAAFSNLYFWSFLGFFLSYAYANYLSVAVKINILIAFLLAGMLGYLVGQVKIKCVARKEYVVIEEGQ